jgi:xanthine/CO dehydrogenase XdhC/CoxF family maturation factor
MIVTRDRCVAGSLSGGCIDRDVLMRGFWRTEDGSPHLVTYDAASEDEVASRVGAGCEGTVDVLLEPDGRGRVDTIAFIASCVSDQRRGALATIFGGVPAMGSHVAVSADGRVVADELDLDLQSKLTLECKRALERGAARVLDQASSGPVDALIEVVLPPVRLFVIGAGHDAVHVVALARTLGWEAVVCVSSARIETRERLALADEVLVTSPRELAFRVDACDRALAVVMSHDYLRDRACLSELLGSRAAYVGMLGPRKRTARMFEELGIAPSDPRVHAPVGLAIGAETPEEIALSIVAEAQQVLSGASGARLRDVPGAVHGPLAEWALA